MRKAVILFLVFLFLSIPVSAQENPLKKLYEVGAIAYEQGKYKNCVSIFEKSLELYSKFAPAYNYLGMCKKEL